MDATELKLHHQLMMYGEPDEPLHKIFYDPGTPDFPNAGAGVIVVDKENKEFTAIFNGVHFIDSETNEIVKNPMAWKIDPFFSDKEENQ